MESEEVKVKEVRGREGGRINGMCNFARDVPAGVHVHDYRRTGGQEGGGEGGREGGREGVGETGEKERKKDRGIRAKKDGTQTK